MGCFLACFSTSKVSKRRKPANRVLPRDQRNGFYEPLQVQPTLSLKQNSTESRDKLEEQLSFNTRKKVTFDLNVKTYEDSSQKITNFSNNVEQEKLVKQSQPISLSEDDSITSSMGSYQLNHRYQNCRDSEDEFEEVESDEMDSDDDNEDEDDYFGDDDEDEYDGTVGEGESSESSFSSATPLTQELKTLRSNENARNRSQYVHSVLNPVENLTQWKAVKAKPAPLLKNQKENSNLDHELQIPFSSEPNFKLPPLENQKKENDNLEEKSQKPISLFQNFDHFKPPNQEIVIDASLSNWLGSSERLNSQRSHEGPRVEVQMRYPF